MASIAASAKTWLVAARPHTLSASVVPVAVGSALAAAQGAFSWHLFVLTLAGSVLVQIGTNFTDEFADHGATASLHKYLAPHKVIARGLLSGRAVKLGAAVVFGVATLIGVYLVSRTGWPLLVVCLVSLAAAYGYSAGPLPLGDLALGEAIVFVLMGPVMVMSTVYVQTAQWQALALWYSLPVGALVTAILIANNMRDAEEDRLIGRRTLVTVFGAKLWTLEQFFPDAKVICCVRNVAWIMDSFECAIRRNPLEVSRLFGDDSVRSTVYGRVEALGHRNHLVGSAWSALKEAYYGEHSEKLLLVEYDLRVTGIHDTVRAHPERASTHSYVIQER
ncbi:MAG: 1,4-dihydroxy-2-naphthoate octaprenyltransferase [SAR324 cluster bacterium]|nr:1,4-dihydroxy-2-naphthoate octaprenyltransferase [SAR324 cluster bacterium]